MRKLLNTLYINTPDLYLSKDGNCVVASKDQKEIFRMPAINLESIVCFSYMGTSPGLMKLCVDNNIGLTFLSPQGKFLARIQGPTRGNVLLRTAQYRKADDKEFSLSVARLFISGKIQNYRNILRRALRDNGENPLIDAASAQLAVKRDQALRASSPDELRGIEGEAASDYFGVFNELILRQKEVFKFNGRNRRPPRDEVNVLLSFVYTLIANDMTSALETVGIDPYVGFFHTLRPGRPSLALDMMEELRAYLGDRVVLSLINRQQVNGRSFVRQSDDMILLTDDARKDILKVWQERKKDEITHPYLQEKMPIGLLPYVQSQLLARYLRGDLDNYPVFLMK